MTDLPPSPAPTLLHPVLRRHLLQLRHDATVLRPLQRNDLPAWRRLYEHVQKHLKRPYDPDAEYRFLSAVQRSRLQYAEDQLLLGAFNEDDGRLIGEVSVHLQCVHAHRAELRWSCKTLLMAPEQLLAALNALGRFLFEQVGLRRVVLMLPPQGHEPLAEALGRSGFQLEGTLLDHHRNAQGWHDRQLYALTAPAWAQRQA